MQIMMMRTTSLIGGRRDKDREQEGDDEDDEEEGGEEEKSRTSSSFLRQIDEILSRCPEKGVQRGLFSATLGPYVKELASNFLKDPITVSVGVENAGANTIDQKLVFVGREDGKLLAIRQLIQQGTLLERPSFIDDVVEELCHFCARTLNRIPLHSIALIRSSIREVNTPHEPILFCDFLIRYNSFNTQLISACISFTITPLPFLFI